MRKARTVYVSASIGKLAPVFPIGAVPGIGESRRKSSDSVLVVVAEKIPPLKEMFERLEAGESAL